MCVCVRDWGACLLAVLCWHEWVNHSHCCSGSRPQLCAQKHDCGRQEAAHWAREEYLGVISPLYKHSATFSVHTRFNLIGDAKWCQRMLTIIFFFSQHCTVCHCELLKQFLKLLLRIRQVKGAQPAVTMTDGRDTHAYINTLTRPFTLTQAQTQRVSVTHTLLFL